jgi:hypothetical protein
MLPAASRLVNNGPSADPHSESSRTLHQKSVAFTSRFIAHKHSRLTLGIQLLAIAIRGHDKGEGANDFQDAEIRRTAIECFERHKISVLDNTPIA